MLYVPASVALPVVPVSIADPVGAVYPCDIALPVYVYAFTGLPGIVTVAFAIVTIPIYFAATPLWFPSASTFVHIKYVPAFVPVTLVFHEVGAVVLFVVVVLFLWVSSKHKESGLGDTCSGNCSSCSAHCSTGSKDKK